MLKKEDIIHIAGLARIGLSEDEIEKYQKELSLILDYFKKLEKVSTEGIETIGHITGLHSILREDDMLEAEGETKQQIIGNFPDSKDNQAKVKSILA